MEQAQYDDRWRADIHRSALSMLICLDGDQRAIAYGVEGAVSYIQPFFDTLGLRRLIGFMSQQWFSEDQSVQELFIAADKAIVLLEHYLTPWYRLVYNIVRYHDVMLSELLVDGLVDECQRVQRKGLDKFVTLLAAVDSLRNWRANEEAIRGESLQASLHFEAGRFLKAAGPHDYVFERGFLWVLPNYSEPFEEAFRKATAYTINTTRRLLLLRFASRGPDFSKNAPSWFQTLEAGPYRS
ncbi:hypothetical protein B0H63DRAFT_450570 [Podospora didyma]|uniref:Uncharacterized protein n=1 Tax=Podospora didyma TaxID=330526 RepID=A0AAE0TVK3_9PEZI|nr:hypothetical protein B0H63DRAFT_450570 [Podospora didyma]